MIGAERVLVRMTLVTHMWVKMFQTWSGRSDGRCCCCCCCWSVADHLCGGFMCACQLKHNRNKTNELFGSFARSSHTRLGFSVKRLLLQSDHCRVALFVDFLCVLRLFLSGSQYQSTFPFGGVLIELHTILLIVTLRKTTEIVQISQSIVPVMD